MANAASTRQQKNSANDALDLLAQDLAQDMRTVNDLILAQMHSDVALIPKLAAYIIAAGGKRLRPLLTLAAAKLCGYAGERHHKLAACVEFIHTATLLHDDVVDESDLRRGRASAHLIFGNQASVLVGDFLFSRAFQLMVEDGSLEVLKILSKASAVIAEGEVLQLGAVRNMATTEQTYLDVICAKTAELFAAACQIGAVVAQRPTAEADALRAYGLNLGIAFQMADDVLDYSAQQARLGKTIGNDFHEGKITLPVILAFQDATTEERAFWQKTLENGQRQKSDLDYALACLSRHKTLDRTMNVARGYLDKARTALSPFAQSPTKQHLLNILDFVIARDF